MMSPSEKAVYGYWTLVARRGTPEEKKALLEEIGILSELKRVFPGSAWQPLQEVKVIQALLDEADALAQDRHQQAVQRHYRDTQGKVGRTVEEEIENTRGQYALQIMLGLPLGQPSTREEAKKQGNAGGGHNAFVPYKNPTSHHLIVQGKHRADGIWWLVVPEGGGWYKAKGWIKAATAQRERYLKRREREGGRSEAYWVPPENLNSVESWWSE